ncbi:MULTISPECIES: hypothetical protein [Nostocales]|uniref:Uncharacterized protein n=3 Tax=Nostocales TaxID=1161 RepID=A0A8S9TE88_9CYAN|nr:hypothetical protein [Tolypothrix bouteillei]KAF3889942.1 hypothetical protein DA73_0400034095 [Tolypothrix bouteillei VB521301]
MVIANKVRAMIQSIAAGTQQVTRYIVDAAVRVFGPRNDNYPEIGVHPFEGEIKKDKG